MIKSKKSSHKGFIEIFVIIIVGLVFFNFIGFDVVSFLSKPLVLEFFVFVKNSIILVYQDLIAIFKIIGSL